MKYNIHLMTKRKCNLHAKKREQEEEQEREHYLSQFSDKDGYMYVILEDNNGSKQNKLVHMLVASTFIPNPHNYTKVLHIDGNKSNNSSINLKWIP